MARATISSLQIGNMTINLDGVEGKSLKEAASDVGIRFDGTTWIVNGERLSQTEAESYVVKDSDSIQGDQKGDGGR